MWKQHLSDNIRSVRQHSAKSLSLVANALGSKMIERVAGLVEELLPSYRRQSSDSKKFSKLETVTQFGVAGPKPEENQHSEESKEGHTHQQNGHNHHHHDKPQDEHENQ